MRVMRLWVLLLLVMSIAFSGAGCAGKKAGKDGEVAINGAGSTFAYPLYSKWAEEYGRLEAGVRINYQSVGSGAGQQQLLAGTVDFGASDAPMSDEKLKSAPKEILHIPTALGAVVLSYNLQGLSKEISLSGDVIAGIFLGKIKKWSDPRIAELNPGAKLPDLDIAVVHRSDGSGTTYVFTDYLSTVSPEWKGKVGKGTAVSWPVGLGAKGNEGVTGVIKQTPGAIGYVELIYAEQNNLPKARVKNAAGEFAPATVDSVTAAAAGIAASMPEDLRVSIVNAPGKAAYPISSFTYILVFRDQGNEAKGRALAKFLWWGIHDGQRFARELTYAPLPEAVVKMAEDKIRKMSFNGKSLLTE